MTDEKLSVRARLLAAAKRASLAVPELISGGMAGTIAEGEPLDTRRNAITLSWLLDSARLLIQANDIPDHDRAVWNAICDWLEAHGGGITHMPADFRREIPDA